MIVLVTCSRVWDDSVPIFRELDALLAQHPDMVLRHGDWRQRPAGVPLRSDEIADLWAIQRGVETQRCPADWARFGRAAGHVRNAAMVAKGADRCLAFIRDGSKGASGCAEMARAAGILTRVIRWEDRLLQSPLPHCRGRTV